jgi:guanosine-3',5'-bis(diphosphate) 3'-pyrophosphohydrolase
MWAEAAKSENGDRSEKRAQGRVQDSPHLSIIVQFAPSLQASGSGRRRFLHILRAVPEGTSTETLRDHETPRFIAQSELLSRAYGVAAQAHAGQQRKDDGSPFISHPVAVARVLKNADFGDHVIAAALLHDVVEDTELSSGQVAKRFGHEVADLVEALSEDNRIDDYEERKLAHRDRVEEAGSDAIAIYIADKLSNLRGMRAIYGLEGEAIAPRFKTPIDVRVGLWRGDLEMASRAVPDLPYLDDFRSELEAFDRERAQRASS